MNCSYLKQKLTHFKILITYLLIFTRYSLMYLWLNFINSFYTVHYSLKCNRRTFTNLLYTLTFVVTNKKTLPNLVINFSNSMRLGLNEKIYEWLCFDMQKVLTFCHNSKFAARFRRVIDLYVVGLFADSDSNSDEV